MRFSGKMPSILLVMVTAAFAQYRLGKPDMMLKHVDEITYLGDNTYNTTAVGQTMEDTVSAGDTIVYHMRVQNDVDDDFGFPDNITVKGPAGEDGWTIVYFDSHLGGSDITGNVTTGTGWSSGTLARGEYEQIRMEITAPTDNPGSEITVDVLGTSTNEQNKKDLIRAIVHVTGTVDVDDAESGFFLEVSGKDLASPRITYGIQHAGTVELVIYDILGQPVSHLLDAATPPGNYSIRWDATSDDGNDLPSGVYFAVLRTNEAQLVRRVLLVR